MYFLGYGGGWGYFVYFVEVIRFSVDIDILFGGFGLFGGRGEYIVKIKVSSSLMLLFFLFEDIDFWFSLLFYLMFFFKKDLRYCWSLV